MNTQEDIVKVKEQILNRNYSDYSFDELLDQYHTLKSIEAFEDTPSVFVPNQNKLDCRKIALQVAIDMRPSPIYSNNFGQTQPVQPHYDLLKEAEAIYQWLIKSE